MPTAHCPACGNDTTVGKFCGACGAQQSVGRTGALRLGAYAAAPAQRVLTPRMTTSLFPQLPPRSRSRFRAGLVVLAAMILFMLACEAAINRPVFSSQYNWFHL